MKILVINIALRPPPARKWLPIGLAYIASAIYRAGYHFDLLDLDAKPEPTEQTELYLSTHQFDVVAMGCIVTGYKYVKWLSQIIKTAYPNTIIIVGNSVASSISQILLSKTEADIAVLGEGDETIIELLDCISAKRSLERVRGICFRRTEEIITTQPREVIKDIDSIPMPIWELFDLDIYIKSMTEMANEPLPLPRAQLKAFAINTARGCPFSCTFCYQVFQNQKYRWRKPHHIIAEMRYLHDTHGINYFSLHDELTFFSIPQAEAFVDALLESGLNVFWSADCRSNLFKNDEDIRVAEKMKLSGIQSLAFSLESSNPDILKWMNKNLKAEDFSRQVEILARAGVTSRTSLVFGFPNETEETIQDTIDYCIQTGIYPSAGFLLPQPGSEIYNYALEKGYITDEEEYLLSIGDRQDLHLNMTKFTDEELKRIVSRELNRCNQELGLNLTGEMLLKTSYYRSQQKKSK